MSTYKTLRTREEGTVLFAAIDSPPINLIGPELVADLASLVEVLDRGEPYRVVVFSSADPEFFLPHVDLTRVKEYREAAARITGEPSLGLLFRRLSETKAITIAQIAGRVGAAGSEFALACDMRFASRERAVFAQLEAGFGQVPGAGGVQHLTRLMGRGRALEVILSADDYDADTAAAYGWINRALPDSELEGFVARLARRIGRFPAEGLRGCKERVNALTIASEVEFRKDSDLFGRGVSRPEVQARIRALMSRGLQERSKTELEIARVLGELED